MTIRKQLMTTTKNQIQFMLEFMLISVQRATIRGIQIILLSVKRGKILQYDAVLVKRNLKRDHGLYTHVDQWWNLYADLIEIY